MDEEREDFSEDFNAVLDGHGSETQPMAAMVSPSSGKPIIKASARLSRQQEGNSSSSDGESSDN